MAQCEYQRHQGLYMNKLSWCLHRPCELSQLMLTSTLWVISTLQSEKLRHRKRLKVTWPRNPHNYWAQKPQVLKPPRPRRLRSPATSEARDPPPPVVKNLPASAGGVGLIPAPGRSHVPQSNRARVPWLLEPACAPQEIRCSEKPELRS